MNELVRVVACVVAIAILAASSAGAAKFSGKFISGEGDTEYLQLLDIARRMYSPDPEFQHVSMLYMPWWNGLVEGPTWDAWWVQNSYGTTYAALPLMPEPIATFLQNAQDLWFSQMGDGKRIGGGDWKMQAPDGCLCDCARPGWIMYKQGDGRVDIHDWGMEFTAAGIVMQGELLLISRDRDAIRKYLPMLERSAGFIETRRDRERNLFLAGPAGNLLAPGFAGYKKPDGTYGKAYLTGLSVTYIAALDRLIELNKMVGNTSRARLHAGRRASALAGLKQMMTPEGYLINSIDPDGTKHGVFGEQKHGYFEASPNHDAICFNVVDDAAAERIYSKIASIPELRPHSFIIPNYPSYDDMYEKPEGLWGFGTWVNGGHWSTCEARMMMGYYRLGKFEDARASMRQLMKFAKSFKMDNPLTQFGNEVYQPAHPINLCYDTLGPSAAFIRGLFGYRYDAHGLTLTPSVPAFITSLQQSFPIRFGRSKVYLRVSGTGPVTSVLVNGRRWDSFDSRSVFLPETDEPELRVSIGLGGSQASPFNVRRDAVELLPLPDGATDDLAKAHAAAARALRFLNVLPPEQSPGYIASHAALVVEQANAATLRHRLLASGKLQQLPEPARSAADKSYTDTVAKLFEGLEKQLAPAANPTPALTAAWESSAR